MSYMPERKCQTCGSAENLMPNPVTRDGNTFRCNPCNSLRMQRYYAKSREIVFEHYGGKCNCCGEATFMFLSIDHVNNDGNKHLWKTGRRVGGVQLYSKIIKLGFPKIYQILCMNCNIGKHRNGGICPHVLIQ